MTPDREAWIAAGGDAGRLDLLASIGTVAPFSDGDSRALATVHPERPELGAIGDWVGGMDVLRAAEAWLGQQGCKIVRGPMEMCRWFDYRATLGPFDEAPFSFEPTTPAGRWVDAGYQEIQRYVSLEADRDALIRSSLDRAAALAARGFTLVPIAADKAGRKASELFRERLDTVHDLFAEAFNDVDGYVPIPPEALFSYYAGHDAAIDPRLTIMALDPKGKPVGLVLAVPDRTQTDRKWYLILTMAVLPSYRELGVGSWLLAAAHQAGRRAGYHAGIHCFVRLRSGDDSKFYAGRVFRRYALMEKILP